jgi:hypothetical protein
MGDGGGVDGELGGLSAQYSEYSLGSSRPHFILFGFSLTNIISRTDPVVLVAQRSGLMRSLTRAKTLIIFSDESSCDVRNDSSLE